MDVAVGCYSNTFKILILVLDLNVSAASLGQLDDNHTHWYYNLIAITHHATHCCQSVPLTNTTICAACTYWADVAMHVHTSAQ